MININDIIEEIGNLHEQRNEIDKRLELLQGYLDIVGPVEKPVSPRKSKVAERTGKKNRYDPKPCCGSIGPRHRKGCKFYKEAGSAPKPAPKPLKKIIPPAKAPNGRMLTKEEFETVKGLQDDDYTTVRALAELPDDIGIQQVNWAFLCNEYGWYVKQAMGK